jgi:hypothetical protein
MELCPSPARATERRSDAHATHMPVPQPSGGVKGGSEHRKDTSSPSPIVRLTYVSYGKTTRGETPSGLPQRPEIRRTEGQQLRTWEHHHPKPDVPAPVVRVVPVAEGTPHEPAVVGDRAAPQHTGLIIRCIQIFALRLLMRIVGYGYSPSRLRVHSQTFPAISRHPCGEAPDRKTPTGVVSSKPNSALLHFSMSKPSPQG